MAQAFFMISTMTSGTAFASVEAMNFPVRWRTGRGLTHPPHAAYMAARQGGMKAAF
jgi:hypothetical protein